MQVMLPDSRNISVMYPEGFTYEYIGIGAQILVPKIFTFIYIDFFYNRLMFFHFNSK